MTIPNKMLGRIFSRTPASCHIIMTVFIVLFIIYQLKQLYNKYQKEKRFAFYNEYVNEVYNMADRMRESEIKSSDHVMQLTKVIQILLKKNINSTES